MLHASVSFPSHWVLVLEVALLLAGIVLAAVGFPPLVALGRLAMRALRALARRPAVALVAIALSTAGVLGLHAAIAGAPYPRVVDEWSYLVAADTFAHNRIANPPHPMWRHLEADHVLQQPTYASKYPPAQGFVLAVGQVAFGHPVAGVWLEAALLVAAVGWMLLAWVPTRWALFGAILVAVQLGAGSYWNQSYWGGSVAATGGALLLGAARRLFDEVRVRDAVLLALGLATLATSRPYEGMLVALPVALLLAAGLLRRRLRPAPWLRLVAPAGALLIATLAGIATINRAITGDARQFPHSLYDRTHGVPPVFLWEPLDTDAASHAGVASLTAWREPRTPGWHRMAVTLHFFLGLAGVLALVLTPALLRDAWARFAAVTFLAVSVGHFLIYPWWPHYSAPALAAILAPAVQGFRHVYVARRATAHGRRAFGRALFGAACTIPFALFLFQLPAHRADATDPSRQRARLAWELEHREGRHLLLVRYPPGWNPDWTYNPADVDAAKVVWATDLGEARNAELLRYYADRTVWHVEAAFTATDPVLRLVRPALAPDAALSTETPDDGDRDRRQGSSTAPAPPPSPIGVAR